MEKERKEIIKKLSLVQAEIKAPKNLFNKFGNYSYRSAEGILEQVKPILRKYGVGLALSDEMIAVGDRVYVKATATIYDETSGESYEVSAFAREAYEMKGMSEPQTTGSASSYARKYALNGLFLLDDNKDPDSVENTEVDITEENKKKLKEFCIKKKEDGEDPEKVKEFFGYWKERILSGTFNGTMNPEKLWSKRYENN